MTDHVFEIAPSARSKCRSCGQKIEKEALRFGESMPNPFSDGNMVQWHHPPCAAFRRPEPLLEALGELEYAADDRTTTQAHATHSVQYRRLQRLGVAERASSGRARCRHCKELIEKDTWRIPLIFFEEGSYNASGYIHAQCAKPYCETEDVLSAIAHFAQHLDAKDLQELTDTIGG